MRFSYVFGDEQLGHSNTIPSIVQERYIAHPSSPINYMGNCQAGVFLIYECIPSPPFEDTPLDITMVDSGEIAPIVTHLMSSTIPGFLLRFFPRYILKKKIILRQSLSTIFSLCCCTPPAEKSTNESTIIGSWCS